MPTVEPGPLLAALSCLQGRPASSAARDLLDAGADGVQLTPGCAPSADLDDVLSAVPTRTHHGYTPTALRRRVWSGDGHLEHTADSIHPPKAAWRDRFFSQAERGDLDGITVEVMYGPYTLGCGDDIERAMALGLRLAVDVSHLHIQRHHGTCTDRTVRRLLAYDHVAEVHLSANDGNRDAHQPLSTTSYGIGWAAERRAAGIPLVLESYMHRLDHTGRAHQIDLAREGTQP